MGRNQVQGERTQTHISKDECQLRYQRAYRVRFIGRCAHLWKIQLALRKFCFKADFCRDVLHGTKRVLGGCSQIKGDYLVSGDMVGDRIRKMLRPDFRES